MSGEEHGHHFVAELGVRHLLARLLVLGGHEQGEEVRRVATARALLRDDLLDDGEQLAARAPERPVVRGGQDRRKEPAPAEPLRQDRKSTRLNSSHTVISYAVFCLKK